jgi:flavin reductase (DIM6/NTAB) family NADH-FMN oxidoreductase RutF
MSGNRQQPQPKLGMLERMHQPIDLKVHYYGTPVVLISSRNEDGSANLAPMSSAWWIGQSCMLGLGNAGHTTANLLREKECVLNLVPSTLVEAVDRLAMTTGADPVPERKAKMGYVYERDKFAVAGLTRQPSEVVAPPRVAECPIQVECQVVDARPFGDRCTAIEVRAVRAHLEEALRIADKDYVDPFGWDPLIMKFCEFFGGGSMVSPSRLAEGWRMPHAR